MKESDVRKEWWVKDDCILRTQKTCEATKDMGQSGGARAVCG